MARFSTRMRSARVSPRHALGLITPFSLLCRSDEGLPTTLAVGDRFICKQNKARVHFI
jgi:hypothetical protein